jgi:hypothetical protein
LTDDVSRKNIGRNEQKRTAPLPGNTVNLRAQGAGKAFAAPRRQ